MKDEKHIERFNEFFCRFVIHCRDLKHHAQEIRAVTEIVVRINKRLSDIFLEGPAGNCGHLTHQPPDCQIHSFLIRGTEIRIKGRECVDHTGKHRHRMSPFGKSLIDVA